MKYKLNMLKGVILVLLGSLITNLTYHLRFENDLLRKELVLFMQDGNGYFLAYAYFNIFLLIIVGGVYLIIRNKFNIKTQR